MTKKHKQKRKPVQDNIKRGAIETDIKRLQRQHDDANHQAALLAGHAETWRTRARRIAASIADHERQLAKPDEPEPFGDAPVVIRFTKKFIGIRKPYHYAAIRAGIGQRKWAITQTSHSVNPKPPMSWDELLDFIGPDHWDTIVTFGDKAQRRPDNMTIRVEGNTLTIRQPRTRGEADAIESVLGYDPLGRF